MCFDPTARPPAAPVTGHAGASRRLTLQAADGAAPAARLTLTTLPGAPGVVILPDVRGLHPYYEALAEEFAGAGAHALALDFYARTAGTGFRDGDFDYAPHRAAARDATVDLDVTAAVTTLRDVGAGPLYVLGFCFGGRAALMQASRNELAGVVGFYGWPVRQEEGGSSPLLETRAGYVRTRVLALFGGADEGIPDADRDAYAEALEQAGVDHEIRNYPGAPHSFFDRSMDEHAEACEKAWEMILDFMGLLRPTVSEPGA
jgi:carboxymethylenebutenolidase